jgi:hypothetical protein
MFFKLISHSVMTVVCLHKVLSAGTCYLVADCSFWIVASTGGDRGLVAGTLKALAALPDILQVKRALNADRFLQPHYQKKYYRFLNRQEQTVQRLESQKWTLAEMLMLETREKEAIRVAKDGVQDKLDAAKDRTVELERKATAKIHCEFFYLDSFLSPESHFADCTPRTLTVHLRCFYPFVLRCFPR